MKILIIDNNIDLNCWGAEDLRNCTQFAPNATIETRRAPEDDLPKSPSGYDRIIVSGSKTSAFEDAPWVDRLLEFIQSAVAARKPFLGVCFGHQMLARSIGGKHALGKAATPEFGWSQIKILDSSDLMKGLNSSFFSFSAHYEEVYKLPKGMKKLAESEHCMIQACQLEELPVFGIQFHPEKTVTDAENTFRDKRADKTNTKPPLKLLNPARSQELYNPEIAKTIFGNFFKL